MLKVVFSYVVGPRNKTPALKSWHVSLPTRSLTSHKGKKRSPKLSLKENYELDVWLPRLVIVVYLLNSYLLTCRSIHYATVTF